MKRTLEGRQDGRKDEKNDGRKTGWKEGKKLGGLKRRKIKEEAGRKEDINGAKGGRWKGRNEQIVK